ncbi:MAG: hypothetical protein ACQEP1_00145 [Nanobdellota archaeon]
MEKQSILSLEDFQQYIRKLPPDKPCYFRIERGVPLCGSDYRCPYKGEDSYPYRGSKKRECRRQTMLEHKRLMGEK